MRARTLRASHDLTSDQNVPEEEDSHPEGHRRENNEQPGQDRWSRARQERHHAHHRGGLALDAQVRSRRVHEGPESGAVEEERRVHRPNSLAVAPPREGRAEQEGPAHHSTSEREPGGR